MLNMHRLLLNYDNHAQRGDMQQSQEHRWGIRSENSGHNPDDSKTESPAMAEGGLKLHSQLRCGKLRFNHLPQRPHQGLGLKISFMRFYREMQMVKKPRDSTQASWHTPGPSVQVLGLKPKRTD